MKGLPIRRFFGFAVLAAILGGLLWLFVPRGPADPDRFLRHRGAIASAEASDSLLGDGRRLREFTLRSTTGLSVRGKITLPDTDRGPCPALVLQGGLRTGSSALLFAPNPGPLVLASLEYPYRLPRRPGFFRILGELPRMRRGAEEGVAGLLLLLDYLESLPEVDPSRTVIVGGSLGAPFAALAGALEPRFEGVAILYGGADLVRMVEARLPVRAPVLRWISVRLLSPWLDPVDPAHFVGRIAPRPVLFVNGRGDDEIPRACVDGLHAAAGEPNTVVWVDTPHRVQGNPELTAPVAQAVWEWMDAWGWRGPGPGPGSGRE